MLLQEEPAQQAVNRADWGRPLEFPEGGHRVECLTGVLEHLDLGILHRAIALRVKGADS